MKINRNKLCALFLLIVNLAAIGAANAAPQKTSADPDKKIPLLINADNAYLNYKTGTSVYTGHVVATHGKSILTGDKITSYRDNKTKKISEIITTGHPATMLVQDDEHPKPTHGKANTIIMYPEQHTVMLIGDAVAYQETNMIHGPKIIYNTQTGVLITESSTQQRAHIFINNDTDSSANSTKGALS